MPGKKEPEESRREDILRAAYDVAARFGVEALTLRAVAARAKVSHGTVLFYFKRRSELVSTLLDRVLYATATLRVPDEVGHLTRPSVRMQALIRSEMDRLSTDPRHFRLFLEYWALGVRDATIRRKISVALGHYRAAFRAFAEEFVAAERGDRTRRKASSAADGLTTTDGVAAVAVSFVHGCALQAVIDPTGFDPEKHHESAARMFERLARGS